ncbi:MAG: M23 family metallopeptidase [Candidatus Woesebacteria bacterium]|nr:M23 family metallopeptidase [Candidatus Woesebacteria bacterium]
MCQEGLTKHVSYDIVKDVEDIKLFYSELLVFIIRRLHLSFWRFEKGKGFMVETLYRQRGKFARRFVHTGMATLAGLGIIIAPIVAKEFPGRSVNPWEVNIQPMVLSAFAENADMQTVISDVRDKIIEYKVQSGDTLSRVAEKFGVSLETIRWQNNLTKDAIKEGQILKILPVTGVSHTVKKGDTVYSIAKLYDTSPQAVVDFPFNTFSNDETFELAIGQVIIIPDGVMPKEQPAVRIRQITPNAGTVVASGNFVWPTAGTITQRFVWYHKGIDIANSGMPDVLAADSGTVVTSGWTNVGYGNYVVIDHGNGYRTLYGHMQTIYVVAGQTVARGSRIGKMGSTGRSTGPHTHFEVILNGVYINPLNVLK